MTFRFPNHEHAYGNRLTILSAARPCIQPILYLPFSQPESVVFGACGSPMHPGSS